MESEMEPEQGSGESTAALQGGDAFRALNALRSPAAVIPRGHAALQLTFSALLAAYIWALVYAGSVEGGVATGTLALIAPPVVIASGLIGGANERFRARSRTGVWQVIATSFLLLAVVTLLALGLFGDGYSRWFAVVTAVLTLLIFGLPPLRLLLRPHDSKVERKTPHPLPPAARFTTILVGVYLGLTAAAAPFPKAASALLMIGMLGAMVLLTARTSPWGLLHTGYEWRLPQWAGFGVAAIALFALAATITTTGLVTTTIATCTGAVVTASIVVSAFVAGRDRVAPEA